MGILSGLLDLVVPGRCAGCGTDGPSLCTGCAALLGPVRQVPAGPGLPPVYALGRYHGPLRTALLAYKERGRRELADPFGRAIADGLRQLQREHAEVCLVPVPSRAAAARRRGGDHVRRLAAASAAALAADGVPAAVAPALRLAGGVRDSVGLDPAARVANLAGRVRPRPAGLPTAGNRTGDAAGAGVVLLDDVATTDATIAACTAALAAAGIRVRAAVVVATAAPLLRPGGVRHHFVTVRGQPRSTVAITA